MAVDAGAFDRGVVGQKPGLERFQVAFFDAQHVPHFIGRFDQAVAQVPVDAVGRNRPGKRRIAPVFAPEPGGEGKSQRIPGLFAQHLLPLLHRETQLGAAGLEPVRPAAFDLEPQGIRPFQFEIQGRDVDGQGDVRIVGKHRRGSGFPERPIPRAGGQDQDPDAIGQPSFHWAGWAYLW